MQHNLSGVTIGPQEYIFSYSNRNTVFQLEISRAAVEYLYSIILNLIKGQVYGLITLGHYEETLKEFYKRMLSGIVVLEDEFGTGVSNQISGMLKGFRVGVRYPLENPRFYKETEDDKFGYVLGIGNMVACPVSSRMLAMTPSCVPSLYMK